MIKTMKPYPKVLYQIAGSHEMMMRDVHSIEQCFDFYFREDDRVIEYLGTSDGYHKFRGYYVQAYKDMGESCKES